VVTDHLLSVVIQVVTMVSLVEVIYLDVSYINPFGFVLTLAIAGLQKPNCYDHMLLEEA
jgi:hypothetical protein